jgi:uncharacterized lipoprotein NlpE involved in copper resistance
MYDRKIMKRLLWTLLFLISASIITIIVGCNNKNNAKEIETYNVDSLSNSDYSIYIIDSCEYIVYYNGSSSWGSHKGNCNNPIHNK